MPPKQAYGIGVILNGGKASRLGGIDKGDIQLGSQTSFSKLLTVFEMTFSHPYVSVAHDYPEPLYKGSVAIPDQLALLPEGERQAGVVLSILTCLQYAKDAGRDFMITCPVDTPFLPKGYTHDLREKWGLSDRPVVVASQNGVHSLHALWPVSIYETVYDWVVNDGLRKMSALHDKLGSIQLVYPDETLLNLNTLQDIEMSRA